MAGRKVRVLYDFEGDNASGELSIHADEMLTVTRTDVGDGWWEGENSHGSRGLFPEAYVEALAPVSPPVVRLPNNPPSAPPYNPPSAPPYNPPSAPYQSHLSQNDEGADGWGDDFDDDETVSNYSEEQDSHSSGSFQRRDTNSGIQRSGTVRKSIYRFSPFVKSGGEAYIIGTAQSDISIPSSEVVGIKESGDRLVWEGNPQPFTCRISEPEKKSKFKGMKSFITYNINTSKSSAIVSRRFKHFDWLYARLVEKFSCISVPPLPDKQITGRFGEEFIEKRREKLELWINRISQHPVMSQSAVFQHFLTCGDKEKEWKSGKRKAETDKLVGASFFLTVESPPQRLSPSAVESRMEQFGRFVKYSEESIKALGDRAQIHCEKCQGSYRNEYKKIGTTFVSLSAAFAIDDDTTNAKDLTLAIDHTGRTYDEIGEIFAEQPKNDFVPLIDNLKEFPGLLSTFPDVLQVHKGAMGKVKECQKLQEEEKMEHSMFQEVSSRADTITNVSIAEMSHFHDLRVADFKHMMQNFLHEQIKFHQNIAVDQQKYYSGETNSRHKILGKNILLQLNNSTFYVNLQVIAKLEETLQTYDKVQ